ncbi:MAG: glycoside hydrolase family 13 protein [Pelomonas sp.]|nr:glycoside hydrolase family 13 protein [Roseateles sp.]MBV8469025.1 glycoside hydrolase family 13 protein [Burkholderiaceae bacterium]MBV8605092.1 glycoside hydrolase family 13 protein [Roseateles sp.]
MSSTINRRRFGRHIAAAAATAATLPAWALAQDRSQFANETDRALAPVIAARERDWRIGAISYQVMVDRFVPSRHLEAKRALYPAPKRLRDWSETPTSGPYVESQGVWQHEIDFWGGDLDSLMTRLDYVQGLGAEVLYLNPIHLAYTNHKYDALDYEAVSPEFGTRADVKKLADELHRRGMRLVLDGVFNHMGRHSPRFQAAEADYQERVRHLQAQGLSSEAAQAADPKDWFNFGPQFPGGARAWWGSQNLPELNLENPEVRRHVYGDRNSVVRRYLREEGIDGWRLDVAFDIGFAFLRELTEAAHAEKPGSLVVGEIANYPAEWTPSVDGVLGFTLRGLMLKLASGQLDARRGQALLARLVQDCGVENLMRSWIYLDNHDTERLATALPDPAQRRLAQLLQFSLPGAPNLYYGSELGMSGGNDPEMRAPMRWDWVSDSNAALNATRRLIELRRQHRALRLGNFRPIESEQLLAFERYTERAGDSVVAVFNLSDTVRQETLLVPDSKLMDGTRLVDLLGGPDQTLHSAWLSLSVPPRSAMFLSPDLSPRQGYSNYKRVL